MSPGVSGVQRLLHGGVTVALIKSIVAEASGLTVPELLSDRRFVRIVEARRIVSYLAHRRTPLSLPAIGRQMGYRDHSGVHGAVRRIADRLRWDESFAVRVEGLEALVLAEAARRSAGPEAEKLAQAIFDDPRRADSLTHSEICRLAIAHLDACARLEALRAAAPLAFEPAFKPKEISHVR